MFDPIDLIAAYPDLSDAEMAELRRAVADDPALAALVACRRHLAAEIRAAVGDRDRFVVCSLFGHGRAADLTPDELELAAGYADHYDAATEGHPGLAMAAADIADAAASFADLWDEHLEVLTQEDEAAASPSPIADGALALETHGAKERETRGTVERPSDRISKRRRGGERRRVYRWAVRTGIAAAVLAFAFIVTQVAERDAGMITVETAADETRVVELAEGSSIRLFESSSLSYADPQSALIRRAELAGRALFEIAPQQRGFIVETGNARVTVLGTTFGVDAQERLTEVVLTEGSLTLARITGLDDLVVLEPGQMSRVIADASPTPPVDVDVPRRLTWTGLFIFQSTPLADIAALLSDHFDVPVEVDRRLTGERVTGTFEHTQPLRDILDVIAAAVAARVQAREAGGYALTHR